MPRKVRDLLKELVRAGFVDRGGKGSHRNYKHPQSGIGITISGSAGDDAKAYQEKAVKMAIEGAKK
jgi:predicted RNA binding protein YcfA (HicA-like mRNA interferase family)